MLMKEEASVFQNSRLFFYLASTRCVGETVRRWDDVSLRRGDVVATCVDVSLRHCVELMMCCVIVCVSLFLCFPMN